jgi:hypothetical protein
LPASALRSPSLDHTSRPLGAWSRIDSGSAALDGSFEEVGERRAIRALQGADAVERDAGMARFRRTCCNSERSSDSS